jgi:hypothetical protein
MKFKIYVDRKQSILHGTGDCGTSIIEMDLTELNEEERLYVASSPCIDGGGADLTLVCIDASNLSVRVPVAHADSAAVKAYIEAGMQVTKKHKEDRENDINKIRSFLLTEDLSKSVFVEDRPSSATVKCLNLYEALNKAGVKLESVSNYTAAEQISQPYISDLLKKRDDQIKHLRQELKVEADRINQEKEEAKNRQLQEKDAFLESLFSATEFRRYKDDLMSKDEFRKKLAVKAFDNLRGLKRYTPFDLEQLKAGLDLREYDDPCLDSNDEPIVRIQEDEPESLSDAQYETLQLFKQKLSSSKFSPTLISFDADLETDDRWESIDSRAAVKVTTELCGEEFSKIFSLDEDDLDHQRAALKDITF